MLKSTLSNAGKWMEAENATNGTYPTSLSGLQGQAGVILSLSHAANGFCVNGEMATGNQLHFSYESAAGGLKEGLCSGAVINGSETGINPNLVANTDFSSGWSFSSSSNPGRTLATRTGVTGDPHSNRPVLVLSNSATTSVTWAIITSGLNYNAIEDGKTYTLSYYVRKVGPFPGGSIGIGIGNSSNTNVTIYSNSGGAITPSDAWQRFTKTGVAIRRETGDQRIYIATNPASYTTSGWQLEFQGFEIREA